MAKETRKARNIQRAAGSAHILLNSSIYRAAREAVESALLAQLKALDLTQRDEEHEIVMLLRSGELFHRMLEGYIQTGNVEDMNAIRRKQVA